MLWPRVLAGICFLALQLVVFAVPPPSTTAARAVYYPPPLYFQHFSFGFKETLADIFWLRLIQDFSTCAEEYSNPRGSDGSVGSPESQTSPISIFPLVDPVSGRTRCIRSWAFRMLDITTDLAPRFRIPFALRPVSLRVLLDDHEGAQVIFDKGIKNFPRDWPILYRAAAFYAFEAHDHVRGAELLILAARHGGPPWLHLLASRLTSNSGRNDLAIAMLEDYMSELKDPDQLRIVADRIRTLKNKSN